MTLLATGNITRTKNSIIEVEY